MPQDLEKLKTDELKEILRGKHMSMSGDKGTLIYRIKLAQKCEDKKLVTAEDGLNPCTLSFGELKKVASKVGVSPLGTQDEIFAEYVKYLETHTPASKESSSSSSSASQGASGNNSGIDPVAIAQKVLEYAENEDYEGILNMTRTSASDPIISRATPVNIMRKAYLKLSLIIHPDKIGRIFNQATKAFQALVKAFDSLTSVDIDVSGDTGAARGGPKGKGGAMFTISRSNEGCYRTRVWYVLFHVLYLSYYSSIRYPLLTQTRVSAVVCCYVSVLMFAYLMCDSCPRCRQPWSEGTLDGNPTYFYNFLMQGLKCYTCSTCLCEFGCMTAIHKCPHCKKP